MFVLNFLEAYTNQIIASVVSIVILVIVRSISFSIVERVARKASFLENRTNLVKRYISYLIFTFIVILLISVWGIERDKLFLFLSSVLTVIGVAFFAQWSILSNITAGVIIFFSFPFKIGDKIKFIDKEFPIEGEILDIKSFYTLLRTSEDEEICLPNNLLLQKGISIVSNVKR
ncbi:MULTISPECIES: mechanosensitive ion channel domain-containing protein [Capnocytophaga]|uniref:Mechanosensitive ion channel protein MscS n=1 Tax=Capnocytophaga canis TaxID=1848903 RepID=A0A0B7IJK6_9FLAO|nr:MULTISPECIES: mechanosensitive ion channel domain-containing protein [Capnocytophaga]ATA73006.1 mechanosensitive ion channel protein MscS [Capnocytophaga sp. H4358]ATA75102.1 mechanosensitive ion channel protein MscS [Capnocytophaga sp. H2931]RIY36990.1 mechanosensitive ion channel protein MscS [Capnocytophaga canis]CEN44955.1 conserved membrane hypothetical protein [Capnocytophaga canis]CEN46473.1 conserved membrane hypothetical protein [Capnocytophaga canis]